LFGYGCSYLANCVALLDVIPSPSSAGGGNSMRPKERRESGQNDLFRARLDQIVDMGHPVAKLAKRSTGGFRQAV
jgi:hypothetical protein